MRPDLQIIARARNESSEPKLLRAGANRVVNPQQLGGDRMASFVTQPFVVDFVDVVMHDGTLEFRLEELAVSARRRCRAAPCARRSCAIEPGPWCWPFANPRGSSSPTRRLKTSLRPATS